MRRLRGMYLGLQPDYFQQSTTTSLSIGSSWRRCQRELGVTSGKVRKPGYATNDWPNWKKRNLAEGVLSFIHKYEKDH